MVTEPLPPPAPNVGEAFVTVAWHLDAAGVVTDVVAEFPQAASEMRKGVNSRGRMGITGERYCKNHGHMFSTRIAPAVLSKANCACYTEFLQRNTE